MFQKSYSCASEQNLALAYQVINPATQSCGPIVMLDKHIENKMY